MRKRISLLLMLMCCTMLLSGCSISETAQGIKESFQTKVAGSDSDRRRASISELASNYSLTDKTKGAFQSVLNADAELVNVNNTTAADYKHWGPLNWLYNIGTGSTESERRESAISAAERKLTLAENSADKALLNDELYLSQKRDENAPKSKQDKSKNSFLIIIAVVVAVLLLLFFLLNKRSNAPKIKAVAPEPVQPQLPENDIQVAPVKQVDANKMNACRKLGEKFGVDADKELVKYNGDVDKLYVSLMGYAAA